MALFTNILAIRLTGFATPHVVDIVQPSGTRRLSKTLFPIWIKTTINKVRLVSYINRAFSELWCYIYFCNPYSQKK